MSLAPPAPASARASWPRRFGIEVSEEQAERALGAEIAFYRAHMGLGRDLDSLGALRRRCAEVLREALPPSERLAAVDIGALTEALLSALRFDAYRRRAPAPCARAAARGSRIVVVSNWDVSLAEVLERVGLAPLRRRRRHLGRGGRGQAGAGDLRPRAAPGRRGRRAGARHVGDSLDEDVARSARRAGSTPCCCAATRRARRRPRADDRRLRRAGGLTELGRALTGP